MEKTNVMRLLDAAGVSYTPWELSVTEAVSGTEAAHIMGKEEESVFKTLVTLGASGKPYVFMIPVAEELSLKKAAKAAREKSVAMLKSKDLLSLTGYIHGGCSPIGMKKAFPTFLDETAQLFETITFSAGKIGYQVEMSPDELNGVFPVTLADLTE